MSEDAAAAVPRPAVDPEAATTTRDPPGTLPVRVRRLVVVLAWALAAALLVRFFPAVKTLLLGVLAAASAAALLSPLAGRLPGPRGARAVVTGLGFILVSAGVVAGLVLLLARPIRQEAQHWPQTRQKLDAKLGGLGQRLQLDEPLNTRALLDRAGRLLSGGAGGAASAAARTFDSLISALIALAFVYIGSMYFLAEPRRQLVDPVLPLLPERRRPQVVAALDDLGPKLRWWLLGVLMSMTIVGVVSGVGFWLVGLKFAVPLALLAALAELVPTIGPIVAFLVALLFAAVQGPGQIAGTFAVWVVVQALESYVILPLVMRRAVRMPGVVTLFSVVFWGQVLGAAGLFMAIPLNLLIWTFVKQLLIRPTDHADEPASEVHPP